MPTARRVNGQLEVDAPAQPPQPERPSPPGLDGRNRPSTRARAYRNATEPALVGRCDEAYRQGGPRTRRLSNQFFFEQILVIADDDGARAVEGKLREPWATLLAPDLPQRLAGNTTNPDRLDLGPGSNMTALVRRQGLEPRTRGLRVRCSAN
jgi:hypothetical protein